MIRKISQHKKIIENKTESDQQEVERKDEKANLPRPITINGAEATSYLPRAWLSRGVTTPGNTRPLLISLFILFLFIEPDDGVVAE